MTDQYVGEEESDEAYEAAYEAHRSALYEAILAYADEHELNDGFLAQILTDLGLSFRMASYAEETDKPSVGGLRLELDRYVREIGENVRDAKKYAAEFITEVRSGRGETAEGDEDAAGEPASDPKG